MITFITSIVLLIAGYAFYSKYIERVFGIQSDQPTPAYRCADGVDYVPLSWGKIFLIQFLNIAGLGPIFGAIMGATFGPAAFLWIVFGSIFGGAVHDYFSGMLSIRHDGMSLHGIGEQYMGKAFKQGMGLFTVLLMVLVGAVFVAGPAQLLSNLTPGSLDFRFWIIVVFAYYVLATLLPIDRLIGRIYPLFGLALLFMAVGILIALFWNAAPIPELDLFNLHNEKNNPETYPIFPMMFISIACGAISGFHATQSPMMARCLKHEGMGRRVFYGAMIVEGLVALIWAAAAMSFFGNTDGLQTFLSAHGNNAAVVVEEITHSWLGKAGGFLAILGVIAAPITSGDTAFRSARLIVSDYFHFAQKPIKNRLLVAIPLFLAGIALLNIDFDIIWRYFAWMNQTLATATLWIITVFLAKSNKNFWITLFPALFMSMVISSYIAVAPEGFALSKPISYLIGSFFSLVCLMGFARWKRDL